MEPIFVKERVSNSTADSHLRVLRKHVQILVITIHSLHHAYALLLLFVGVSIASVATQLGHSSMTTTQEVYLHIIQGLESQDNDKVMRHLVTLV